MSVSRVQMIQERCAMAARGKCWRVRNEDGDYAVIAASGPGWTDYICERVAQGKADADFIANAPADIRWLLGELERLREAASRHLRAVDAVPFDQFEIDAAAAALRAALDGADDA